MKITLVRHFTAKDIAGMPAPNQYRHLHFPDAEQQAKLLRGQLAKEVIRTTPQFSFLGHSTAIRAKYSLLLATIGLGADNVPIIEIPNLFPLDDDDGRTMMAACKATLNPSKWAPEQQEALKRFGQAGADSIRKALADASVTEGKVLIFTHGPMINAQAAYLAGGDEETVNQLFAIDTKEGDRFIVEEGQDVRHVPLS